MLLASDLISAFTPNFGIMLLGRAMLGAALGGFWTMALSAAGRLVRERFAAKATAMIMAGVTLATVIGVPLGTLISDLSSWRMSFIATAALTTFALAAQAFLLPSLPSNAAVRLGDLMAVLRRAHPRKSLLMVMLVFGAHFSSYTYIAPFLAQNANFSLSAITALLLGFGVVGFISNFAVSAAVTRNLKGSLLAMVGILMIALFALPLSHGARVEVSVMVLAWGVAFGAIPLCLSVWMQQSVPDMPEAGSALFISIIQVAIALGSLAGGSLVDKVGVPMDFRFGSILALSGLGAIVSFRIKNEKSRALA
jgi:predicted MFS family arabinose efflux permease